MNTALSILNECSVLEEIAATYYPPGTDPNRLRLSRVKAVTTFHESCPRCGGTSYVQFSQHNYSFQCLQCRQVVLAEHVEDLRQAISREREGHGEQMYLYPLWAASEALDL